MNGQQDTDVRQLNQCDTFVRFNKAITVLEKIKQKSYDSLSDQVSRQKPFGLRTFVQPSDKGNVTLYANKSVGKIERAEVAAGKEMINSWKLLVSRGYGEGGEARDYPRMIMGRPILASPPSACTETHIVVGSYDNESEARNLQAYLRTKFLRFLLGLRKNTQDIRKDRFAFVPLLPMKTRWTDQKLYGHFGLTQDEITFIESMVRPMSDDAAAGEEADDE